jgi:hypothetical protein
LGLVEQTLFNWVKAKREGKLSGADSKAVSAEKMEISRLRAELARVKMERDTLEKATACCSIDQKGCPQASRSLWCRSANGRHSVGDRWRQSHAAAQRSSVSGALRYESSLSIVWQGSAASTQSWRKSPSQ